MKLFNRLVLAAILMAPIVAMGQTGSEILPEPAFNWRCSSGNAVLNHNPAMRVTNGAMVFDSIPFAKDYTVIIVYKPVSDGEAGLWRLTSGDSVMRGLTTERILTDSVSIRYASQTDGNPAINTLRQSWPSSMTSVPPFNGLPDSTTPLVRLAVGGDGVLDVAEVIYYGERLGNAVLRRIQSQLAIRYGVTLGPVTYLDGAGGHIWEYADSGLYHHRVTGVGRDTLTGLRQLRSRSEMEGTVLAIATDSLGDGSYLIVGDNDAPIVFEQDGGVERLQRSWRIQSTEARDRLFTLVFDTRDMATSGDSLALLVDDDVYLPDVCGGDSVVFTGVEFNTDSSRFTLIRGGHRQPAQDRVKGDEGTDIPSRMAAQVYPNPTDGHYAIEVEGAGQVQVTIYNVQGVVVATYRGDGNKRYRFEGELPSGNVYYAVVSTENGSQTMKLVVR